MRLSDIQHDFVRKLANMQLSKPALAINAGAAATIKTTGTNTYSNRGKILSYAALAATVLAADATIQQRITGQPGFYIQPVSTAVYYLIVIDAAGTVKCIQGTYAGQTFTPFVMPKGTGDIPSDIGDYTPIGYIKITTNGATTFTVATTALDAAGLTVVFGDLSHVPDTNP